MNFKELEELILEAGTENVVDKFHLSKDFPQYDIVQQNSGYDDGNESLECIVYFPESEIYVRLSGYHESYSGTYWNPKVEQVFPEQKTVTIYSTKK